MSATAKKLVVILAIAITTIMLTITAIALLSANQVVYSTGTITTINLGVYSDSACTQNLTTINWGQISPGNNASKTIYIKNTGNTPITLSMTTNNWNPSTASSYITLTLDKAGTSLAAGASTTAKLTLAVSSSISDITSFSVNIVIAGTA